MNAVPPVIVRKGGLLTALFHGLFGFLAVLVICGSAVAVYGLHVVDGNISRFLELGSGVVAGLPQWREVLPPALAEALDDRRAPEYRGQLEIAARTAIDSERPDRGLTVIEVHNRGTQTVSLLALNVTLETADGVPVDERQVYAATPIACEEAEWRGPLLPEATRRFALVGYGQRTGLRPRVEVAELRLWNGPTPAPAAEAATETSEPLSRSSAAAAAEIRH